MPKSYSKKETIDKFKLWFNEKNILKLYQDSNYIINRKGKTNDPPEEYYFEIISEFIINNYRKFQEF